MRLSEGIRKYVAAKRTSGMAFSSGAHILRAFTRMAGGRTSISKVSSDVVRAFLNSHGPGTRYWNGKYHTLRGFWTFAIQRGYTDWSPLPARALKEFRLFTPHVYTHEELRRLLDGISTYQKKWYRLEPISLRAMILLLYGAGLRIGEAIRLTCADVGLSDATLIIRCSKFYKTRRIAISPHLCNVLREYDENRRARGLVRQESSPFFSYNNGGTVKKGVLETGFRKLRHHVGIGPMTGRRQPRIHDLRHYAECRTMRNCVCRNRDKQYESAITCFAIRQYAA